MTIQIEIAHKGEDYIGINYKKGRGDFETMNYREVSMATGETIKHLLKAIEVQATYSDNKFKN